MADSWSLSPDRGFRADPAQRAIARDLYASVRDLPLVCPHGHVDPALLGEPNATLGTPAELFIIPDHYVFRMLYSQGVPLESLGVAARDGVPAEQDHRLIWRRFCEQFHLFRATPTGLWLAAELVELFGVDVKPSAATADQIYDHLAERLARPEFTPRALFDRFRIETLCTTDATTDTLHYHQALRNEGWGAKIRPTFRPDAVVNLLSPSWRADIDRLSAVANIDITDFTSYLRALEQRRAFFKEMGATATDHAAETPYTAQLSAAEVEAIFAAALQGTVTREQTAAFTGHMLIEFARMSVEDGMVMQLHVGSSRNHNDALFTRFGPDKGADIPLATEWTRNLRPLLNAYGSDARYRLILFTLDESTYSRELAPLVGHYPALLLGPPWWFFDSVYGMRRYFEAVMETAGLANTAGFNDDTRAFASIPARHDVWRRVSCDWIASALVEGLIDEDDAREMALDCAVRLARRAYKL